MNRHLGTPLVFVIALLLSACSGQTVVQPTLQGQKTSSITPASTLPAPTTPLAPTIMPVAIIPATGGIDCMGARSGESLSLFFTWSGSDEAALNIILKPLVDACGIVLKLESTQDQARLAALVNAGTPPDVAFVKLSQIAQFHSSLKPLTDLGAQPDHYAAYWQNLGSVDGSWLGLPVKVDIKTILWYSPANFKARGYQVPSTGDDFLSLVDKMASDGIPPFSTGLASNTATGQMGVDLVNDIILMDGDPVAYDGLISGKVSYNSSLIPAVNHAYMDLNSWVGDSHYGAGGAQGALSTDIHGAIAKVFSDPPQAMMLRLPGSAGALIAAQYPNLKFGTGFDFFMAPGAVDTGIHGSSDWLVAFNDSAVVKALVAFLSSDRGGQIWAQVGFGVTPNRAGLISYTDDMLKKQAQTLADAKGFLPDLGEAIPGGFAAAEETAVVDYLKGADLASVLNKVAAVQKQALSK